MSILATHCHQIEPLDSWSVRCLLFVGRYYLAFVIHHLQLSYQVFRITMVCNIIDAVLFVISPYLEDVRKLSTLCHINNTDTLYYYFNHYSPLQLDLAGWQLVTMAAVRCPWLAWRYCQGAPNLRVASHGRNVVPTEEHQRLGHPIPTFPDPSYSCGSTFQGVRQTASLAEVGRVKSQGLGGGRLQPNTWF